MTDHEMYNLVQNYENTYLFVTRFVQILLGIKFTRNEIVIIRWNEICKTGMRFNTDNLHSKRSAIENGKCPRTFNRGCIRAYRNKPKKEKQWQTGRKRWFEQFAEKIGVAVPIVRLSRNVCISRFIAATFQKTEKFHSPPLIRFGGWRSTPFHIERALLSALKILYFPRWM